MEDKDKKISTERESRYSALQKPGDPNKASQIIDNIEGVYKTSHLYHPLDGSTAERLENILEIVRVSSDSIYFRMSTNYGNAHGCDIHGLASYKENGSFLYDDKASENDDSRKSCFLKIISSLKGIHLEEADDDRSCMTYCSVLGAEPSEFFGADRKRSIRYMERLKNSSEYREAINH